MLRYQGVGYGLPWGGQNDRVRLATIFHVSLFPRRKFHHNSIIGHKASHNSGKHNTMKFSQYTMYGVSSGWIWPWGSTGNVIKVGVNGVVAIESHPEGFIMVTVQTRGSAEPIKAAVYPGGHATIMEDSLRCGTCKEVFKSTQALSNHAKVHEERA